jgi:hypothetical protein
MNPLVHIVCKMPWDNFTSRSTPHYSNKIKVLPALFFPSFFEKDLELGAW